MMPEDLMVKVFNDFVNVGDKVVVFPSYLNADVNEKFGKRTVTTSGAFLYDSIQAVVCVDGIGEPVWIGNVEKGKKAYEDKPDYFDQDFKHRWTPEFYDRFVFQVGTEKLEGEVIIDDIESSLYGEWRNMLVLLDDGDYLALAFDLSDSNCKENYSCRKPEAREAIQGFPGDTKSFLASYRAYELENGLDDMTEEEIEDERREMAFQDYKDKKAGL